MEIGWQFPELKMKPYVNYCSLFAAPCKHTWTDYSNRAAKKVSFTCDINTIYELLKTEVCYIFKKNWSLLSVTSLLHLLQKLKSVTFTKNWSLLHNIFQMQKLLLRNFWPKHRRLRVVGGRPHLADVKLKKVNDINLP